MKNLIALMVTILLLFSCTRATSTNGGADVNSLADPKLALTLLYAETYRSKESLLDKFSSINGYIKTKITALDKPFPTSTDLLFQSGSTLVIAAHGVEDSSGFGILYAKGGYGVKISAKAMVDEIFSKLKPSERVKFTKVVFLTCYTGRAQHASSQYNQIYAPNRVVYNDTTAGVYGGIMGLKNAEDTGYISKLDINEILKINSAPGSSGWIYRPKGTVLADDSIEVLEVPITSNDILCPGTS